MLAYLIIGITYGFAAAAQPGPFQTYLVSRTLSNGWRRTFPAAFAPLLSDIPVALLVLLVLGQVPVSFERWLHIGGGLFILYVAFGAFRSWRRFNPGQVPESHSTQKSILDAVVVNLLNPNPYIGWSLVMGPLLLKGWREARSHGITLIAAFYGSLIPATLAIVALAAAARGYAAKANKMLILISAIALLCFALYQLWLGFASLA